MELELALRVMDLLASHYESLQERMDSAEARIKDLECAGECSCQTWREHTQVPQVGEMVAGNGNDTRTT